METERYRLWKLEMQREREALACMTFAEIVEFRRKRSMCHSEYATKGRNMVYFHASYRHTQRAEFEWMEINWDDEKICTGSGHPKTAGFTKKNGWTINPEMLGAQW